MNCPSCNHPDYYEGFTKSCINPSCVHFDRMASAKPTIQAKTNSAEPLSMLDVGAGWCLWQDGEHSAYRNERLALWGYTRRINSKRERAFYVGNEISWINWTNEDTGVTAPKPVVSHNGDTAFYGLGSNFDGATKDYYESIKLCVP